MRRATPALAALLAVLALASGDARPQARGPSYHEIREEGQHITSAWELEQMAEREAREEAEKERIALLDPAVRAERFARLDALLRRLPGRFRIEGRIEQKLALTTRTRPATGMADCTAVGESTGLNCIINASWLVVEEPLPGIFNPYPLPSEHLNTMQPGVLVVGFNRDPPGLRAMLVTADTLAHNWVGVLGGAGADLKRAKPCEWTDVRCYESLELVTGPDDPLVSFVLTFRNYTIRLTLHPDPEAVAGKPAKPARVR